MLCSSRSTAGGIKGRDFLSHSVTASRICLRARLRNPQLRFQTSKETAPSKQGFKVPDGYVELLVVTLLWGSYNPAVRYIFSEQPEAVDPATLTFIRSILSATALAASSLYSSRRRQQDGESDPSSNGTAGANGSHKSGGGDAAGSSNGNSGPLLSRTSSSVLLAGLELGLWNFLGTALQVQGLQLTTATRAGFLVQLTGALTPVTAAAAGVPVPPLVWAAVAIGLGGSCLVAWDGMQAAPEAVRAAACSTDPSSVVHTASSSGVAAVAAAASSVTATAASAAHAVSGEAFLLLSCVFYSLATVRLSMYAPKMRSIDLAAVKKATLTVLSLVWLVASQIKGGPEREVATAAGTAGPDLLHGLLALPLPIWLLIAYTGLGPGASATYLQTRGQASVPAPQAQVIFSLTPLWSALFAYVALGGESMGPWSWAGGACIVAAGLIATAAGSGNKDEQDVPVLEGGEGGAPPQRNGRPGSDDASVEEEGEAQAVVTSSGRRKEKSN